VKFNILSDLHLGLGALPIPDNDADVAVLAGDLARPREAIEWAARLGKPALYVAGNHEFYGGSLDGTVEELRQACSGTNVRLLDNEAVVVGGVRVLGSTLWTDFLLYGADGQRDAAVRECLRFNRDYSRIRVAHDSGELFSPDVSAALFERNAAWLAARLAEPFDGPTVVITHHAPSPRSIHPRFAGSLVNACFVSDAERLLDGTRARLWIHGHTHDSFDYEVNGTRVVCNPRGYAREGVNENRAFDPDFVVEVA
jgi:predicted phosphodiesterase